MEFDGSVGIRFSVYLGSGYAHVSIARNAAHENAAGFLQLRWHCSWLGGWSCRWRPRGASSGRLLGVASARLASRRVARRRQCQCRRGGAGAADALVRLHNQCGGALLAGAAADARPVAVSARASLPDVFDRKRASDVRKSAQIRDAPKLTVGTKSFGNFDHNYSQRPFFSGRQKLRKIAQLALISRNLATGSCGRHSQSRRSSALSAARGSALVQRKDARTAPLSTAFNASASHRRQTSRRHTANCSTTSQDWYRRIVSA